MSEVATTAASELQVVNRSLDLILTAIIELDERPRRDLPPQPGPRSMAELAEEYAWGRPATVAERFAQRLKYDPVREALCHAVRMLGQRLNEIGGFRALRDACDRQENYPSGMRRVGIVDHRFDGIGEWLA